MQDVQNIGFVPGGQPVYILLGGLPLETIDRAEIDSLYISPQRQQAVQQWTQRQLYSDDAYEESGRVLFALDGRSDLGPLTPGEQAFLLDQAIACWTQPPGIGETDIANFAALEFFADRASVSPVLGAIVAEYFAERAADSINGVPLAHRSVYEEELQTAFATYALMAANYNDGAGMVQLINNLEPEQVSAYTAALRLDYGSLGQTYGCCATWDYRSNLANDLLQATAALPPTPNTSLFITTAFMSLSEASYAYTTMGNKTVQSMAAALANLWFPNDPTRQAAEAQRFGEFFADDSWRSLFVGELVTPPMRLQCFRLFLDNPSWTATSLAEEGKGWENKQVLQYFAGGSAELYSLNAGHGDPLIAGTDGVDAYLEGVIFPGIDPNTLSDKQQQPVDKVVKAINDNFKPSGVEVTIETIPVTYASNHTGPVQLPLFKVTDPATGNTLYFDTQGLKYNSLDHWATTTNLPPGRIAYPAPGSAPGTYKLEIANTPDTTDTFWEHVESVADVASFAGGIIGCSMILTGVGAPIGMGLVAASSAWGAYRSASELDYRQSHGQSIALTNPEALPIWVDLTANVLSLGTMGFGGAANLMRSSSKISTALRVAAVVTDIAATGADAASFGIQSYQFLTQIDQMEASQRAFALGQLVFMGTLTAVSAKAAYTDGVALLRGGRSAQPPGQLPDYELTLSLIFHFYRNWIPTFVGMTRSYVKLSTSCPRKRASSKA